MELEELRSIFLFDGLTDQHPRFRQKILGPRAHDRIRSQARHQLAVQGSQRRLPGVTRRAGANRFLEQAVDPFDEPGRSAS